MTHAQARKIAIEAMEAQIKTLQIDADLCDVWSSPQPDDMMFVQDFRTPRRVTASEKRTQLRAAIVTLQEPAQVSML